MTAEFEQGNAVGVESEFRARAASGRHLAEQAFLNGFMPIEGMKSAYDDLRNKLFERIIGQPEAINQIIDALDRSSIRHPDDNKPIATFAFLGPTGVGKSETAKALAQFQGEYEDDQYTLVKVDCSNFSSGHEVATLLGSPPGYIGASQDAKLSKDAIEHPGTVVLFDEIEKGSKELYNLMLQIMDDGVLQLHNGDEVDFRDTIIIITSNLGAKEMSHELDGRQAGFGVQSRITDKAGLEKISTKAFKDYFSPEFTNRIDKLVVFHPLSPEAMLDVLNVKMAKSNAYYEEDFGVRITLSDSTKHHLVEMARQEPNMGARPLMRALDSEINSILGKHVNTEAIQEGTHVHVFHRNELPTDYKIQGDADLIFTAKEDKSIKKKRIIPLPSAVIGTQLVGPINQPNFSHDPSKN